MASKYDCYASEMAALYRSGLGCAEVADRVGHAHGITIAWETARDLLAREGVQMRARGGPPTNRRLSGLASANIARMRAAAAEKRIPPAERPEMFHPPDGGPVVFRVPGTMAQRYLERVAAVGLTAARAELMGG